MSKFLTNLLIEQDIPVKVIAVNRLTGAVVLQLCDQITPPLRAGETGMLHLTTNNDT